MSGRPAVFDASLDASRLRVAVVVARYNAPITDRLLAGAVEEFARRGGDPASLTVLPAPGSFELATLAGGAAKSGRFDAVVALGCLIKGET
ncbi:MAG: 6,7-dimethyl-8-ribityllumazine synthase, partial [Phycisphaerales bacterium]|nr:6,7-dimethyl-8-ribityllumazine synthase [Phycisphaerales bacterium]